MCPTPLTPLGSTTTDHTRMRLKLTVVHLPLFWLVCLFEHLPALLTGTCSSTRSSRSSTTPSANGSLWTSTNCAGSCQAGCDVRRGLKSRWPPPPHAGGGGWLGGHELVGWLVTLLVATGHSPRNSRRLFLKFGWADRNKHPPPPPSCPTQGDTSSRCQWCIFGHLLFLGSASSSAANSRAGVRGGGRRPATPRRPAGPHATHQRPPAGLGKHPPGSWAERGAKRSL